jgi:LemA protein
MELQDQLTTPENRIAYTRRHYNDILANFNTFTEQFPSNIVANIFKFVKRPFLEIPELEKAVPEVRL